LRQALRRRAGRSHLLLSLGRQTLQIDRLQGLAQRMCGRTQFMAGAGQDQMALPGLQFQLFAKAVFGAEVDDKPRPGQITFLGL